MKTHLAVTASAVLLGLASLAQAAELVSAPLPTLVGATGACHIRNTGTAPISVTVSLFANNAPVVEIDECNGVPLPAGHTCRVQAALPDDSFAACSVTAGNVSKLRGTFEIHQFDADPDGPFPDGLVRTLVAEDLT